MDNPRLVREGDFSKIESSEGKIKFLLNYAVLAPSNHNAQPWLFRVKKDSCEIRYDPKKAIIEADPEGRDVHIGFGCLIENFITSAEYFGVFDKINILPDGENNIIAEIFFKNLNGKTSIKKDKKILLSSIVSRINTRGVFEKRSISDDVVEAITTLNRFQGLNLHLVSEKDKIDKLARLTERGLHMAYRKKEFRCEMAKWVNNSLSKRREGIPGYSLRMPFLVSFIFSSLVKNFNIGKKVGKLNYISASSAPLISVITSPQNDAKTWIDVGRLAERIMLYANSVGLKTSIFIASIEIGELHKEVAKILNTNERPQFLMCIGYMDTSQKPNLRHSVESKLINKK